MLIAIGLTLDEQGQYEPASVLCEAALDVEGIDHLTRYDAETCLSEALVMHALQDVPEDKKPARLLETASDLERRGYLYRAYRTAWAARQFAVVDGNGDPKPAQTLMEGLEPQLTQRVEDAAAQLVGAEAYVARQQTTRGFAQQLAEQARAAHGDLRAFIEPDLGVVVIHNISGYQTELDHVLHWPNGEYDYTHWLLPTDVEAMQHVGRWSHKLRVRWDEDGCEHIDRVVLKQGRAVFAPWLGAIGAQGWAWEDELWLIPYERIHTQLSARVDQRTFLAAKRAALIASHTIVIHNTSLAFGFVKGRWVLVAIDISTDGCG